MSLKGPVAALLALVTGRRRRKAEGKTSEALVADDATTVMSASQEVTVPIGRPPPGRGLPLSKSRRSLPWPARDATRLQRPFAENDAEESRTPSCLGGPESDDVTVVITPPGLEESSGVSPPLDGAETNDVTVVIASTIRDHPPPESDVTVVLNADGLDGRRPS